MKVLLIATNRHGRYMTNIQAQPLPIGLAYIAGYLVTISKPELNLKHILYFHQKCGGESSETNWAS